MATGAVVMERMVGSVDALARDEFASDHPQIGSWLIEDMLGIDSTAIFWWCPFMRSAPLKHDATDSQGTGERALCLQQRTISHGVIVDPLEATPVTIPRVCPHHG